MKICRALIFVFQLLQLVDGFHRPNSLFNRRSTLNVLIDQDWLMIFDSITTDIAKLGSIIPIAAAAFAFSTQEKSLGKDIKATNDLLSKDIKSSNDYIKATNDLLSKDIKSSNDNLSKDIKTVSDNISRLEKIVEKLAGP
jgi:hypothetical protein